nr:MOB kinase activator 3A isoform X2 [Kogia breviceps]
MRHRPAQAPPSSLASVRGPAPRYEQAPTAGLPGSRGGLGPERKYIRPGGGVVVSGVSPAWRRGYAGQRPGNVVQRRAWPDSSGGRRQRHSSLDLGPTGIIREEGIPRSLTPLHLRRLQSLFFQIRSVRQSQGCGRLFVEMKRPPRLRGPPSARVWELAALSALPKASGRGEDDAGPGSVSSLGGRGMCLGQCCAPSW